MSDLPQTNITKYRYVDEDGNIISPNKTVDNKFSFYQKNNVNADSFKFNGEIGTYSQPLDYIHL